MEEKIKAKLEVLRAGLQADGGDLEFVKLDGKVVYLRLVGHCGSCPFAMTAPSASLIRAPFTSEGTVTSPLAPGAPVSTQPSLS